MVMLKKIIFHRAVSFLLCSILVSFTIVFSGLVAASVSNKLEGRADSLPALSGEGTGYTYVLDAGHGGEDGGAVAADGTKEKDLNLSIAETLDALLRLNGNHTVMTRTEDILMYDYFHDREDYTGHKKMYDLRNRLKIAEREENAVYVGIHMNKFSDSRYSGLQVYYSPNAAKSNALAGMIQMNVKNALQKDNNRSIKAAGSDIYILSEIQTPAVLIECGFLSNLEECAALNTESYRRQLAASIFYSLCSFEKTENDPTYK